MNMIELVDFNGISYLTREINEANERFNSLISRDCHSIVTNDECISAKRIIQQSLADCMKNAYETRIRDRPHGFTAE